MNHIGEDSFILGVDIGGTKIATGLVKRDAHIMNRTVVPTPNTGDVNAVVNQVFGSIEETLWKADIQPPAISGIGIATPGPLDPKAGIIFHAPNIPAFHNTPILSLVQSRYGIPTLVENDANAAGLAEALFGAGVDFDHVLYVTVSTGIGTGIIINQHIFHGHHGCAGEGGHVLIDYQGRLCGCGRRGCIEAYASGTALNHRTLEKLNSGGVTSKIVKLVGGNLDQVTPLVVAKAAQQGDELALSLIGETGRYLALWLGNMVNLLDPDIIIIGGGISSIGDVFFDIIRNELPKHTLNPFINEIRIVPARLQNDAGILGAAALHFSLRTE